MRGARKVGPIRRALAQILLGVARFFEWAARLIAPPEAAVDPSYLALAKRYPGAPEHWLRDVAERMGNFAYAPVPAGKDAWRGGEEVVSESPAARADRIARSDRLMDDWRGAAETEYADEPAERPSRLPSQVRLRAVPRSVDGREHASRSAGDRELPARDTAPSSADALEAALPTPKPRALRPRILSSPQAARQDRPTPQRKDIPRPAAADAREPSCTVAPPPQTQPLRTAVRIRPKVSLEELPSPRGERMRKPQTIADAHAQNDIPADEAAHTSVERRTAEWNDPHRPAIARTTAQEPWWSQSGQARERREAYDPWHQPRQAPPDFVRPSAPPSKTVHPLRWRAATRTSYPIYPHADEAGIDAPPPEIFEWRTSSVGSADADPFRPKGSFVSPPKSTWPSVGEARRQVPVDSRWPDLPQSMPLLSEIEEEERLPSVTARLDGLRAEQERGAWSV